MKSLIAYFSYEGTNTIDFEEVNVEKGHTRIIAEYLNELIPDSDIYRITPVKEYPHDYEQVCKRAKEEYEANKDVEINTPIINLDLYDNIYIGFPIWFRSYPRVISSFLNKFDLSGKSVIPFCTNEEGSFGMADMELDRLVTSLGGTLLKGISIRGSEARSAKTKLASFIG